MITRLKILHIENTTACNLRCLHCQTSVSGYVSKFMPWNIFEKLIPIMQQYKPHVMLNGHGETLLSPDFERQAAAVAAAGCDFEIQTNAQLLSPEVSRRLLDGGHWEHCKISIDGATRETYEEIRRGASFEKLMANTLAVRDQRSWAAKPRITFEMVLMLRNVHEACAAVHLAKALGGERIMFTDLDETVNTIGWGLADKPELLLPHVRAAMAEGAAIGIAVVPSMHMLRQLQDVPTVRRPCRHPWHTLFISVDGAVRNCCALHDITLGQLGESTIEEIWRGEALQQLRQQVEAGQLPRPCVTCPWI